MTRTCNLGPCVVAGCDNKSWAREMCYKHYQRDFKHGDTSHVGTPNRENARRGPTHPNWVNGNVGYRGAHDRLHKLWGSARQYNCVICGRTASNWAYDGTDPEQRYGERDKKRAWSYYSPWPEFYAPMCGPCHHGKDKALAAQELQEYRAWKHRTGKTLADLEVSA